MHTSLKTAKLVAEMIGCFVTGILPRPKELIEATRVYERNRINQKALEEAFLEGTKKVIEAQTKAKLSYITDGMLKWQDLLRPFTKNLEGLRVGALARWFNNNTFYRRPLVFGALRRTRSIVAETTYIGLLPKNLPWKAIMPAPYTFARLSENKFYKNERELMFAYAEIIREEIENLAEVGFKYVQLSDPALVYTPFKENVPKDTLSDIKESLKIAFKNVKLRTCLQTFFGDFSKILPEALDFPVSDLGIDLYETNLEELKEYSFDNKGVALGVVDARSSLLENERELLNVSKSLIEAIYPSKIGDVFICPNCDLEFLPWERAEQKLRVIERVVEILRSEEASS
ncbi:MAG: hypothetical protein NZ932_01510 [Candidatus Bathyarchaeota archaeon]|nr:hypothetical protein [Candidatus Bathyarchaeota archaeon]